MRQTIAMIAIVIALCAASVYFKAWKCGEMFPDASLMACLLWK